MQGYGNKKANNFLKMANNKNCKDCKFESDGVPDCVIDGVCPLGIFFGKELKK